MSAANTMARSAVPTPVPIPRPDAPYRLISVGLTRWRVVDRPGHVCGHIDAQSTADGIRYRALRYHAGTARMRPLGEFCRIDDAIECVRFSR